MKRHITALFMWTVNTALSGAALSGLPAQAQVVPEPLLVIDSSASGKGKGHIVSAQRWMGPAFFTGATPTQITELSLALQPALPARPAAPRSTVAAVPSQQAPDCQSCNPQHPAESPQIAALLHLYRLDPASELPVGYALASTSLPVETQRIGSGALTTFGREELGPISAATLRAFHKYALVVSAAQGDRLEILDNRGPANAYLFSGGFSGAATGYLQTLDGGTNWMKDATVTPAIRLVVTGIPGDDAPPETAQPQATVGSRVPLPWTQWPWFMW